MTNSKVTIEMDVDVAQEALSTLQTMEERIAWILENQQPRRLEELKERAKKLKVAVEVMRKALNARALRVVK